MLRQKKPCAYAYLFVQYTASGTTRLQRERQMAFQVRNTYVGGKFKFLCLIKHRNMNSYTFNFDTRIYEETIFCLSLQFFNPRIIHKFFPHRY